MMIPSLRPGERYVGQQGLIERFGLRVPSPFTVSIVGASSRKTEQVGDVLIEWYRPERDYGDTVQGDIHFALRNEPVDLCIFAAAMPLVPEADLCDWVLTSPRSLFARKAWFFYEYLTKRQLPIGDGVPVAYDLLLDPERHFIEFYLWSSVRHHLHINLIGNEKFCPIVRRTAKLEQLSTRLVAANIKQKIDSLTGQFDPDTLRRAVEYMYTKETRSSFEIEKEDIKGDKATRFVKSLKQIESFNPTKPQDLIDLQNIIVSNQRFHARNWRDKHVYIGEYENNLSEKIHCIFPKPKDVPDLMDGWNEFVKTVLSQKDSAITFSAMISFGFVFIHPFLDGNGRIHRFLIHFILNKLKLTPPGMIFPVSAAILRDTLGYDQALESVSKRIMPFVIWERKNNDENDEIVVINETKNLYRYFDATKIVEYLSEKILDTIEVDFPAQLNYLARYDRIFPIIDNYLDGMAHNQVSLLTVLCLQNHGKLAKGKKRLFPELTDTDFDEIERLIAESDEESS